MADTPPDAMTPREVVLALDALKIHIQRLSQVLMTHLYLQEQPGVRATLRALEASVQALEDTIVFRDAAQASRDSTTAAEDSDLAHRMFRHTPTGAEV